MNLYPNPNPFLHHPEASMTDEERTLADEIAGGQSKLELTDEQRTALAAVEAAKRNNAKTDEEKAAERILSA